MKLRTMLTTVAVVAGVLSVMTPAGAATLVVDDDGGQCPGAGHTDIQSAIAASSAGDTIEVCPGVYPEVGQIHIAHDLAIEGVGAPKPVIRPTADTGTSGDSRGWFLVDPGVTFDVSDVVLDGSGFKIWQAIRQRGEGTVTGVDFQNITRQASGSPFQGTGIAAFGTGPVDVSGSTFTMMGRIGVLYFGNGPDGSVFSDNVYTGKGPGDWLDYALDISAGVEVTVTGNDISGNRGVASTDGSTSAGILVTTFFAGGTTATIVDNVLTDNTTGIFQGFNSSDTSSVEAHDNDITGNGTGYRNVGAGPADATCNYWGSPDGPSGDGPGSGDSVKGDVDYAPWQRVSDGPCDGGFPEPESKDDCKNGGWMSRGDDQGNPFKNQGDCVSYVATGGKNKADG